MDKTAEAETCLAAFEMAFECRYGQLSAYLNRNFRGHPGFVDGNAINLQALSGFMKSKALRSTCILRKIAAQSTYP